MATCKRCRGAKEIVAVHTRDITTGAPTSTISVPCPDCKGTGEVEDGDSERAGDNTNKGDGDGDA